MSTFLFWNIQRKSIGSIVGIVATQHDVDMILLAECVDTAAMLPTLNAGRERKFFRISNDDDFVQVYSRFLPDFMNRQRLSWRKGPRQRYTIWELTLPGCRSLLLAAAHLPSKLHRSEFSQHSDCFQFAEDIRRVENERQHQRTVLVGDLNMNPFEPGMVDARGLNAVMTRDLARQGARRVQSETYPFFYNPMWRFFGDSGDHPPGTYYRGGEPVTFFWNMFDQVLLRPDLLDLFHSEALKILVSGGNTQFLTTGSLPDESVASDHLPIVFKLHL
jgi:hypothetical protein